MSQCKIITAEQAADQIQSNDMIVTGGFIGIGFAETLAKAIEKRFLEQGQPNNLSLLYAAGQGDAQTRGLNHFGHEGMIRRVIGGHWGLAPSLGKLAIDNKIEAYNLPQGVICHMFRDIAAGKPGTLTCVGLNTFVDPRFEGGKINVRSEEELVQLLDINGQECLLYKHFPLNIALLRGTTADKSGNISMEREALPLDSLAIAQAVKNSGGKVFVQVEQVTDQHLLTPDRIRIPGILVDHVIISEPEDHPQTFAESFNPAYTGQIRATPEQESITELDARKIIARRALMDLQKNSVVNLGIGMPEMIAAVAAEEGKINDFTLTVEPGGIGGQPASGLSFGAVSNAEAVVDQPAQFDFYDGGGLDQAFLGLAETCPEGHVNVSKFGSKLAGAGGFINITQNTQDIYFLGTFTSGKQEIQISDGKLTIISNGKLKKFKKQVQQITFNGEYATQCRQKVTFITERAVFKLTAKGLLLTEIAPGLDLQKDILDQMDFVPLIDDDLTPMDSRLFHNKPMRLEHPGSRSMQHMRALMKKVLEKSAPNNPILETKAIS
ncbi:MULTISPECIES: CoA-transferase [unclassified Neptuniibacter]|uniref:acyl CoA:acetate/3-ketoacid CoA transferase n=1 Tax=unclassified Neptuniibacter TaxID=2630693 RepID=UPI000C3A35FE|nr:MULTISPECIES: CoA-transferase [unclassified Neptuniibacter]MAY40935.1 acyl CoA:acetate/3-ketoacid CoA transferase [Oceanospirillaceae bacterium]|tara:strand:+ start:51207 stop:52859 length:1653 start_codon:yes stop_codon:yes gene_type:complete